MSDWDRYLIISCIVAAAAGGFALTVPLYVLLARRKRGVPPRRKPIFRGSGALVLLGVIFAPTWAPVIPLVLFTSLDKEELLLLLIAFFFLNLACFFIACAPLATILQVPPQKKGDPWAGLKAAGLVLVSLLSLFIASEGIRDFVQPRLFIEGRIERKWTEMGKYLERPYIRVKDKDHKATWKAYDTASVGWPFRAEIGASSHRIYRLESTWGGSMRPQQ